MIFYSPVDKHSSEASDESNRMHKAERLSDFSSQSVLCAMDRFVKAVNNMNETVMVPSRLLDMSVDDKLHHKVPPIVHGNTNPHSLYNALNSIKNDLIRGLSSDEDDSESYGSIPSPLIYNTAWSASHPTSTMSKTSSTSDLESENDWDVRAGDDLEGMEDTSTTSNVIDALRNHLITLQVHLNNLTKAATYINDCYKNELST